MREMRAPSESPPIVLHRGESFRKGNPAVSPKALPPLLRNTLLQRHRPSLLSPLSSGRWELGTSRHQSQFSVWQVSSLLSRLTREP